MIWRKDSTTRIVVGDDRSQSTLFPERLDDYFGEDNPVWAVDIFVDELDLAGLSFGGVEAEATCQSTERALSHLIKRLRVDQNIFRLDAQVYVIHNSSNLFNSLHSLEVI